MEPKSNGQRKKELDPIPLLDEAQWEDVIASEDLTCAKAEHFFAYVSGVEAECRKCHIGYILPTGGEIRDGHIYIEDELII